MDASAGRLEDVDLMHDSVATWIREQVSSQNIASANVLEIASYATDGGPVRHTFTGPYIGVDLRPGPNVDQVADANDLPFEDCTFEVVVCTEMLEHDRAPWRSISEMFRVLRPSGTLLLTARGFDHRGAYPVHLEPVDYWRFSTSAIEVLLADAGFADVKVVADPQCPGVFAVANRPTETV